MKTYRYRKHIRWLKPFLAALPIAFMVVFLMTIPWTRQPGFAIALTAFFVAEAVIFWILYGRLAAVEVSLGETGIAYRGKKGLIEIPYEEITVFRYPSIRYLGGWIKIKSASETIRLTVVVEGIGTLIRDLKAELDRRDLSSTYRTEKLFRFYKTAEYSDQSWERVYEFFWKIALLLGLSLVIGFLLGWTVTGEKQGSLALPLWAACSLFWAALIYFAADMVLARRLAKASDETSFRVPGRDRDAEKRVFKGALVFGAISYLVAVIGVLSWHFGAR